MTPAPVKLRSPTAHTYPATPTRCCAKGCSTLPPCRPPPTSSRCRGGDRERDEEGGARPSARQPKLAAVRRRLPARQVDWCPAAGFRGRTTAFQTQDARRRQGN